MLKNNFKQLIAHDVFCFMDIKLNYFIKKKNLKAILMLKTVKMKTLS